MKIAKLASLVISISTLTACGGGGGSGGQPTDSQPTQMDRKETHSAFNLPKEQLRKLPIGKVENEDVAFGRVTGYNNKYSFNGAWKEVKNKDEVKELLVENIRIPIANKFATVGGLTGVALSKTFEALWNVAVKDDGSQRDVFYFGHETPASVIDKQKGKAVYKGNATRYDNVKSQLANIGQSTLNVDFDTKKVKGELDINGLRRNIVLEETDIKGNRFEGVAVAGKNHVLRSVKGHYEGKFFGPNAEEIAGEARFKDKEDGGEKDAIIGKLKDLNTSFSAEKQPKK
ncbi:Slam-dependent surface lipoprotein [Pasteurella sp. PK-2025]|uniref:Slam-dependent surface lipoprotein n=1 Tax=Pasteurella sp. PK-2025 TaxID=3413133 RepID=UPI003C76D546